MTAGNSFKYLAHRNICGNLGKIFFFNRFHFNIIDICLPILLVKQKLGNILFNNALNIFYLQLYDVAGMVKDHSDSEKGNLLQPHRLLFPTNPLSYFSFQPWYVLSCLWDGAYKRTLAVNQ